MTHESYLRQKPILNARSAIIQRVERGEISREEAEAERARLGAGEPFVTRPDPLKFDPMQEGSWSLPMALAYIRWQSADPVREMWDEYRAQVWEWQPGYVQAKCRVTSETQRFVDQLLHEGKFELADKACPETIKCFVLRPRPPATFWDVDRASDAPSRMTTTEAYRSLCRKAQLREIEAQGFSTIDGQLRRIEPYEWVDLHPRDIHGVPALRSFSHPERGYDRVSILSAGAIERGADTARKKKSSPQSEKVLRAYRAALAAGVPKFELMASAQDFMKGSSKFLDGARHNEPNAVTSTRVWKGLLNGSLT